MTDITLPREVIEAARDALLGECHEAVSGTGCDACDACAALTLALGEPLGESVIEGTSIEGAFGGKPVRLTLRKVKGE